MRRPLFLIGAPRSGSTFLTSILNCHPAVHVTNEARIFVLFHHVLQTLIHDNSFVGSAYSGPLAALLPSHMRSIADGLYLSQAHVDGKELEGLQWLGEKYPHYADPLENGGANKGCVDLIARVYPEAHFIHIHRHPFQSVASIVRKGWLALEDASLVWAATTAESSRQCSLHRDRSLSISWWNLCAHPSVEADRLTGFLALQDGSPIARALDANLKQPVAVSDPVSGLIDDRDVLPLDADERRTVWKHAGTVAEALGYSPSSATPIPDRARQT